MAVIRTLEFDRLEKALKKKITFDGRNLYMPDAMEELGFTYYSAGKELKGKVLKLDENFL